MSRSNSRVQCRHLLFPMSTRMKWAVESSLHRPQPPCARGRRCCGYVLLCAVWAASLSAQAPVAPTDETTQPSTGDNTSNYNILQSFELGYRWRTVGGDEGMYRSTVNYNDGIRLLSSSLSVQSREGHGR